ncbi:DUF1127 domain-containing protein [Aquipseudomonas campi]|uniref:DUF1127 domain-containing protein n=1 Tax=Aquipseudomonas campi TaxID=2731681 RepID=A0A6M8FS25_9GAMM|nr:DUF1127 domain-containing protein [Pseudomonas campi]QKE63588.1 DUF1127 domain-containing protein [Pseudomonas campi]
MKGQKGYAVAQSISIGRVRPLYLLKAAWRQVVRWWELAEQRRRLAMLDGHALKDLGLSRADVLQESERPFWDDPLKR